MLKITEKPHQGPAQIWYADDENEFTRRVFEFHNVHFQDITKEFVTDEWCWVEGESVVADYVFERLKTEGPLVFINYRDREYTLPGGRYGFHAKADLPSFYEIAKRINGHDLQSQTIETVNVEG